MKKKKKVSPLDEYIKANRKGSREAEIENHGRPVSHNRVHVSKKVYNRKRDKADASALFVSSGSLIYSYSSFRYNPSRDN